MDDYRLDVTDIARSSAAAPDGAGVDHPSGYRPDPGLVDAVNVALILNRPLLVTGEPGTGKTQLAYSIAWQLASRRRLDVSSAAVLKFETKSTTVSRDLFYAFDVLGRFHAAKGGSTRNIDYLTFNALGRALLDALPAAPEWWTPPPGGPRRSVVLIDEIDKAPRDFPNDLLNELDEMYFRVPELENVVVGGRGPEAERYKPVVVITSNSEKMLPDPFLRRCIYYDIPFPDREQLEEILIARLRHLDVVRGPLLEGALGFFLQLRERRVGKRRISAAELMQWIAVMLRRGARPDQRLQEVREHALAGLPALTKDPEDQRVVREELGRAVSA
jgi:MoxR-like ATPase